MASSRPSSTASPRAPVSFTWIARTAAANPKDGSLWVVEEEHPDVPRSPNRLPVLNADGQPRHETALGDEHLGGLVIDADRGAAWATASSVRASGVRKFALDGRTLASFPVHAQSLSVEPDTGYVWAAGRDGVYRLDPDGKPVWHDEANPGRSQTVCVVP